MTPTYFFKKLAFCARAKCEKLGKIEDITGEYR